MSCNMLLYISLLLVSCQLVTGLQIIESYNLTTELITAGSYFKVIGDSVIYLNDDSQIVKMGLTTQQAEAYINAYVGGFTYFNDSVGVFVVSNETGNGNITYFYLLDSNLEIGNPVHLKSTNIQNIDQLWTVTGSPDSVVYGFAQNGTITEDILIIQIDVTTGEVMQSIAPCILSNGTLNSIQSYLSVPNPNSETVNLLAILCDADPETMTSNLIFLNVEDFTIQTTFSDLGGEAAFLHYIDSDVIGWVVLINDSVNAFFALSAYSVTKNTIITSIPISPYLDYSTGNYSVVMTAVGDGEGTIFFVVNDFPEDSEIYNSTVTSVTYDNVKQTLNLGGTVWSSYLYFNFGYPNGFIMDQIYYVWAYFTDNGMDNENLVLIGN